MAFGGAPSPLSIPSSVAPSETLPAKVFLISNERQLLESNAADEGLS